MIKEIILKSLKLKNFKGIKDLHIDFSKITNIFGENGTGKTSIADAFTWLLFDKDSLDRVAGDKESNFQPKTKDKDGQILHGLEHQVTGVLNVNGKDITLSKIYKEKWTKKRGEANKELTGHETLYYVDEVPVKKSEYQDKINSLINEQLFKLISNPLYFSTNMKWQDRRNVILDIIGDITADRIINYRSDLKAIEPLLIDKDINTLKKSIQARRRKLNDDIKAIPIRIDEANNSIKEIDFDALDFQRKFIIGSMKQVEERIMDFSKVNEDLLKDKSKLYELKSTLKDIEYKAKEEAESPLKQSYKELQEALNEENKLKINLNSIAYKISTQKSSIKNIENEMQKLREGWSLVNQEVLHIPEDSFICPTCKRPFDEHDIEIKKDEMLENFNQSRAKRLGDINTTGKKHKDRLEEIKAEIETLEIEKHSIENKLREASLTVIEKRDKVDNFKPSTDLETNSEYQDTLKEIKELEAKLQQPMVSANNLELKAKKSQLENELEDINKQLASKEQNEKLKARIAELQEEEKKLAQQIATLEGQEFLCEEFIKTKVELLESNINSKFKYVHFKLFNTQINGGLEETCEALIDGITFSNANTASQYNAGIDIINALCDYYEVQAPILMDGRESVNKIIDTNSQVINLIVSTDKSLRVEGI